MPRATPHRKKSGEVVWRVQYRIDGKVVTDTFDDEKGGDNYAKLVERVGGKAAREVLARRRDENVGASPTFAAWVHTYLSPESGILTGIQPGTRHGYERIAERALRPFFGEYPINTITRDDVGRWVQWVESQPSGRRKKEDAPDVPVSAKTVKNYQALLSNIFKAAVERGHIPTNPVRGVKTTAGQSREGVFLSPVEYVKVLEQIPEHYKPLVVFMANTGTRWGEATALTWADIDLARRPPHVSINKAWKKGVDGRAVLGPPKSKAGRRSIPLSEKVVAYLPTRGAPDDLVFTGREGGRLWYGMFNTRIWKPAVKRSGIDKTPNIHDLRHSYASWLMAAGTPITEVQRRLGHEKIETTVAVYGHMAPGADLEIVNVLDRIMAGVPDPVRELTSGERITH
jgi:integrase